MKVPYLSRMTVPAALGATFMFGALAMAPLPAHSAIQPYSVVLFAGNAFITPGGNIEFITLGAPPPGFDARVRILPEGNLLSWEGYNAPNPAGPNPPIYQAGINNIVGGLPPIGDFLQLPAVVVGGPEVGPAVGASRFVLNSWDYSINVFEGVSFFRGVGQGLLFENGATLEGTFALTAPFYNPEPGAINGFSAELQVIPVPGAIWLFGSGLIALLAMRRRR